MGHRNIATTQRYLEVQTVDIRRTLLSRGPLPLPYGTINPNAPLRRKGGIRGGVGLPDEESALAVFDPSLPRISDGSMRPMTLS
jgi:hypothetical protein